MARRPQRSAVVRPSDEAGQTTVLTIGLCAVLVAMTMVLLAVTHVAIQHRRVQSLADSAALAGAEELGFQLSERPTVVLSDADVVASATAHLDAVRAGEQVPGLTGVHAALAGDRTTVTVRITAEVNLVPTGGPFAGVIPATVPVEATGSSRTALSR